MTADPGSSRRSDWPAWAAVAAVVVFNVGWLVAGWVEDPPFSAALHDISDLGAQGASAPWLMLVPQASAGILTMIFAFAGLRPTMTIPGRGEPIGAWMVAFSLMGLDNVSDLFFRLPCSSAEPGCTISVATASLPGALHYGFGAGTALVTVAAPFLLAGRMRLMDEWRDLARGAIGFGVVLAILLASFVALDGRYGQGYAQRSMALVISVGVLILAARVRSIQRSMASGSG